MLARLYIKPRVVGVPAYPLAYQWVRRQLVGSWSVLLLRDRTVTQSVAIEYPLTRLPTYNVGSSSVAGQYPTDGLIPGRLVLPDLKL